MVAGQGFPLFGLAGTFVKDEVDLSGGHQGTFAAFHVVDVGTRFDFALAAYFVQLVVQRSPGAVESHHLKTTEIFVLLVLDVGAPGEVFIGLGLEPNEAAAFFEYQLAFTGSNG